MRTRRAVGCHGFGETPIHERRYFATDTPAAFERERLGYLRDVADPITARRLSGLGIGRGWRCLEVAAGAGGMARWMAEKVGPRGQVVATDRDTRHLAGDEGPNLEVRRHDILEDDLETARYDLVHCRMLLQHLADPLRALERMTAALRPGGWLLIEASDWDSYGAADPDRPAAAEFDRRSRTIFDHMRTGRVLDPYFGRRVSGLVERLGLADLGHEGTTWVSRGAGPGARFSQMSLAIVRGPFVAAGLLTAADFDGLDRTYEDTSFSFADMTLYGAWGRRRA
jgi:SAM-dependent methyltransferase